MTDSKNLKSVNSSFYVFDIQKLKSRIEYLKSKLPDNLSLCYAVKANTFVIKEIENDVDRLEVCSPGEASICESMNINKAKIVISGVYKNQSFIEKISLIF